MWCNEHERYEDRCFICRPEFKEEDRLWCEAHKLYEDECFLCRPELEEEPLGLRERMQIQLSAPMFKTHPLKNYSAWNMGY